MRAAIECDGIESDGIDGDRVETGNGVVDGGNGVIDGGNGVADGWYVVCDVDETQTRPTQAGRIDARVDDWMNG